MKIKILLSVILAGFLLVGCKTEKPKIGLLVHSFDTPRWQNDKKYFEEAINELGGTAVIISAENNEQKQIQRPTQTQKKVRQF